MLTWENKIIHQLFFLEQYTVEAAQYILNSFESRHLIKVLRKKKGDIIFGTNGSGLLMMAEILSTASSAVTVQVLKTQPVPRLSPRIILAPALIRPQLFDWIIEKSIELGVSAIIPLVTDWVEHQRIKTDRWRNIAITAIKQSLQCYLPDISEPVKMKNLENVFKSIPQINRLAAIDSRAPNVLPDLEIDQSQPVLIVIGPEGGFSRSETDYLKNNQFLEIRLGPNRLRTETASITALAQLQQFFKKPADIKFNI